MIEIHTHTDYHKEFIEEFKKSRKVGLYFNSQRLPYSDRKTQRTSSRLSTNVLENEYLLSGPSKNDYILLF